MKKKLLRTLSVLSLFVLMTNAQLYASQNTETAIFAGGCFWCMESDFEQLPGINDVVSGYSGGESENPNYDNFAAGGHIEVIKVSYDPSIISYSQLLDHFWRHVDPTDAGGQFCDRGPEYSTAVFAKDENQKALAEQSKATLVKSGVLDDKVVTPVLEASTFYPAEDFHQDYSKKRAFRYMFYRYRCGRDDRLDQLWADVTFPISVPETTANFSKPTDAELKQRLTPLQYKVTQHDGTEPAFHNKYWDNKQEGIYVDIVSGEPLFSSLDKYKSGTGWPSFTKPLEPDNIITKEDNSWFMLRTEVRSKHADSHLGHVFDDGPAPTGLRYCMNSASMRFIAKEDLAKEGYAEYADLFEN